MQTQELSTHQEELKEIFKSLPSASFKAGDEELKVINFSLLQTIVGKMMDKAYYHGTLNGMNTIESALTQAFSK